MRPPRISKAPKDQQIGQEEQMFADLLDKITNLESEYFETLVNPGAARGAQQIHGAQVEEILRAINKMGRGELSKFLDFLPRKMQSDALARNNISELSQNFILENQKEIQGIYEKAQDGSTDDRTKIKRIKKEVEALIDKASFDPSVTKELKVATFQILTAAPAMAMTIATVNILAEAIAKPMTNIADIARVIHDFGKNIYLLSPEGIGPIAQELERNLEIMSPDQAFDIFHKAIQDLFDSKEIGNIASFGLGGLFLAGYLLKPGGLIDTTSKTLYALADAAGKLSLAFSITTACIRIPFAILSIISNIKTRREMDKLKYSALENSAALEELKSRLDHATKVQASQDKKLTRLAALRPAIFPQEKKTVSTISGETECMGFFASSIDKLNTEIYLPRKELSMAKGSGKAPEPGSEPAIKDLIMQTFASSKSGLIISSDGYLDSSRYEIQPIIDPFDPDNAALVSFTKGHKLESRANGGIIGGVMDAAAKLLTTDRYQTRRLRRRERHMEEEAAGIQAYINRRDANDESFARRKAAISDFVEQENNLIQSIADALETKREMETITAAMVTIQTRRSQLSKLMKADALERLATRIGNKPFLAIASKVKQEDLKYEPKEQVIMADLKVALSEVRLAMGKLASKIGYTKERFDLPYDINKPIRLTNEFMKGVDKLIREQTDQCLKAAIERTEAADDLSKNKITVENSTVNAEGPFDVEQPLAGVNKRAKALAKYTGARMALKAPNRFAFESGRVKANVAIPLSEELKAYLPLYVKDKETGELILIRSTKLKKTQFMDIFPRSEKSVRKVTMQQYKKMKKAEKKNARTTGTEAKTKDKRQNAVKETTKPQTAQILDDGAQTGMQTQVISSVESLSDNSGNTSRTTLSKDSPRKASLSSPRHNTDAHDRAKTPSRHRQTETSLSPVALQRDKRPPKEKEGSQQARPIGMRNTDQLDFSPRRKLNRPERSTSQDSWAEYNKRRNAIARGESLYTPPL